ncbi:hypothetical protein C8F01DRAFT_519951 [Mycena amicta]|nr:hypothetical protein C8F01DRAFT_519951 [Mycena amicta]
MREKAKLAEEKNAAVAAAIAQTKSEMQATSSAEAIPSEDLTKKHAEELKALEHSLSTKHAAELKAAIDAGQAAIQAARVETAGSAGINVDALIAEAIAKHEESQVATRKEEINAAVDRGRQEATAKSKLKDSQLVKTQKKVKDLEALVQSYREQGLIPVDAPTVVPSPTLPTASTTTTPLTAPVASTSAVPPARGGAAGAARGAVRGAARGTQRGRGAAPAPARGGAAAGAARAAAAATNAAAASTAEPIGISIAGASKRPRDESIGTEETSSLAKRLKPAPEAAKPPVQIRRLPPPAPAAS